LPIPMLTNQLITNQSKFLQEVINNIMPTFHLDKFDKIAPCEEARGFIGVCYKPVNDLKGFKKYREQIAEKRGDEQLFLQTQSNIALFMGRLLVSRFEISIFAFQQTLAPMIASSYNMLDWFEKEKLVPIYPISTFNYKYANMTQSLLILKVKLWNR